MFPLIFRNHCFLLLLLLFFQQLTWSQSAPGEKNNKDVVITYDKVWNCLQRSKQMVSANRERNYFKFPSDAEAHYADLLMKTRKYRGFKYHSAAGYAGPWIENLFIEKFMNQKLSFFSGLFPLFIQWTDIHVNTIMGPSGNSSIPKFADMLTDVASMLRDDVFYVTVNQDDEGITSKLAALKPNIIVISAGGYGHIAIPLVKGLEQFVDKKSSAALKGKSGPAFTHELAFFGNIRPRLSRFNILQEVEKCSKAVNMRYESFRSSGWRDEVALTKFNLAPRGFGRTSYRLAEIVQIGRIPVYLYDDIPWLPYPGTDASIEKLGYVMKQREICSGMQKLKQASSKEIDTKLQLLKKYRSFYTYDGVIEEIAHFFESPFNNKTSFLRCTDLPEKDH